MDGRTDTPDVVPTLVVRILVTFHYSLLLVTAAVGIRYLVFVTLIVTRALRAERGSRVAAAVILIPNSISVARSLTGAARSCREWQIHSSTHGPEKLRNYNFQSFIYRTLN